MASTALTKAALPVVQPPTATATVAPNGNKKQQVMLAARELNAIGWGNQGSIVGMHEMVEITKVWPNPWHPVEHSDDEVAEMTTSLLNHGQQEDVLVCFAYDKRSIEQGGTGGTLVIEDGHLRYRAALRAGLDKIRVTVRPFQFLTSLLLDWGTRTIERHTPNGLEIGRLIMRSWRAYQSESANNPSMPPYPSQEELGRMFRTDQSTINQWIKLARQSAEFVDMVEHAEIEQSQALELLRIHDEVERMQAAYQIAEENELARQQKTKLPSVKNIRLRIRAKRQLFPEVPHEQEGSLVTYTEMLTTRVTAETSAPLAMGYAAHDLHALLTQYVDQCRTQKVRIHPALTQLQRALADPAIQEFVATLA